MTANISDAMAELRRQFAMQLPVRLDAICLHFQNITLSSWQHAEIETLHRLLHGICSSADTFGMALVSKASQALESRLSTLLKTGTVPTPAEWQSIGTELEHLAQLTGNRLETGAPGLMPPQISQRPDHAPLVYLVEDDPQQAAQLGQVLQDNGYRVQIFTDPSRFSAVCANIHAERPSAVLMDMLFPEGDAAGTEMLQQMKSGNAQCPPVIFASIRDDMAARLAALRAGACRYLVKPINAGHLVDVLNAITVRQPYYPYRVLMVDDEPLLLETHAAILAVAGMEVRTLTQPLKLMDAVTEFAPDVVILDTCMPEATGPELAAILREREEQLHLPILFLSGESDISRQLLALNLGGDDFLVKPVQAEHLVAAVAARAQRARQNDAIRQRLETTLYEREREHLAVNQHAIISIADQQGNITYVNDKFCDVSGYSTRELLGQNHHIVKSGVHPPAFYQDIWQCIARGQVWQGEICNRRKDGSLYWVESTITPFLDQHGKPYQYVSIRTDITHVKAAEVALRESEERYRLTLTCASLGTWDWNITTGQVEFNERWAGMRGYQLNEIRPHIDSWKNDIHPEDEPSLSLLLDEHFAKQTPLFEAEYRVRTRSGAWIWILDRGAVIERDARGAPLRMAGTEMDISARKLAEQELEAHKERLRRGQIFANVGTWDWQIQTGDLYWSERIAPLFGYAEGELETSYDNFLAAVHPDDRQAVVDAVGSCVAHDTPYEIEHRVVWPDGTVRWLLERGAVVRGADGKPLHMLGVVQDIDDRKRAEMALAEREQQLREAQKLARIGNWSADMTSGTLTWSDEIYRIFGHQPQSFAPSIDAFQAAIHPEDRDLVHASEKQAEKTGLHDVVHRIVRPDGTVRYVHELAQAETDATGNLKRLTGTVQDVTERVESNKKIHETEQRFAFAVEGAGDGVWDWNMLTNTMQFSRVYMEMLGYTEYELPHHIDTFINSLHPDDKAGVQQNLQDFLEDRTQTYATELRIRCKSGSYKWILCRGTIVERNSEGKPVHLIGIHSDISVHKRAEAALIEARDEADRANQAKSEFLSSMSHELRTPMNAVLGFGQLMEYDSSLPEEHQDSVKEILKAGHHLLTLINEVLDLAKVESGQIDLSLEPVEVCPVVEDCLHLMSTLADKYAVQLDHIGLKDVTVRADRTRLRQVLLNLLANAIKYNRRGGSVKVEVQIEQEDRLRILVTDTGPGISPNRLQELFQPFNRLDADNSEVEGTGIGLTITRRIVEMMGGAVNVRSEVGVGSTFWIELPLEAAPKADYKTQSPATRQNSHPAQSAREKQHVILYIEDNPSNLKLVAQILGHHKHVHLLTAHTPELGIELALARQPELILLDINMPGMDGYQVLEIFKSDALLKNIPVVAVTANAMPRDIERGQAAGFTDYLTKPLDVPGFHTLIDRLLGRGAGDK
jgi:hypothetical protein